MTKAFIGFIVAIAVLWTSNAIAQTAELQPKLVVDAPLPEPLSRGVALIRYRTENLQILPVFGPQALDVSPRIGHLHVAVVSRLRPSTQTISRWVKASSLNS